MGRFNRKPTPAAMLSSSQGVGVMEGAGVKEAHVIEDGAADAIDDREGELGVLVGHGVAAEGLIVDVMRPDVAIAETADGTGATDEEAVEERDLGAVAEVIGHAGGAGDGEDAIVGQEEVFLRVGLELVDVGLAEERTAGELGGEVGVHALAGEEHAVPVVIAHAEGDGAVGAVTAFHQQLRRGVVGEVVEVEVLDGVGDGPRPEWPEGAREADGGAKVTLVVVVGKVSGVVVEEIVAEGEALLEEPRFLELDFGVLALETVLEPDAEFLAATGEVGEVEDVEVALGDFDEAEEGIDRAEARAEGDGAGALFLDGDDHVLTVGNGGVLRGDVDAAALAAVGGAEVLEVLEALLGVVDLDAVVDFAGRDEELAADDLVLGAVVALDDDLLDVGLGAFLDVVEDVDLAALDVGLALGRDDAVVDVALAAVEIGQGA